MSLQTVHPEFPENQSAPDARPHEETMSLAIQNMHCGGCLRSVEKALAAVPGVSHARANLSAKRVTVRVTGGKCNEDSLVEALANAGFKDAPVHPRFSGLCPCGKAGLPPRSAPPVRPAPAHMGR